MMTINEVLTELKKAEPNLQVHFDFCYCVPTKIHSWCGNYQEPALGWSRYNHSATTRDYPKRTVTSLIHELEEAIDFKVFSGWKGGEFTFSGFDTLHIDNNGDSSNTELSSVEVTGWGVILHTELNTRGA